jgi:hypothetical protein
MFSHNIEPENYDVPAFMRRSKKIGVLDGGCNVPAILTEKNHQVVAVQTALEQPPVPKLLTGPSK